LPSAVCLCKINVFSLPLFENGYKEVMERRTCAEYITQSLYLIFLSKVFIVQELFNERGLVVWFSFIGLTFILEAYEN
jgi:hypothetical protein